MSEAKQCIADSVCSIGPKVTTQYLLGETNAAAPIYRLIASYEYIPVLFMSLYSISLVEIVRALDGGSKIRLTTPADPDILEDVRR